MALESKNSKIVIISSSPHNYVSNLSSKFGFEGFGSHFTEEGNFLHLQSMKKYEFLKVNFPSKQYRYKLGISDNASDEAFSSHFENWIKI